MINKLNKLAIIDRKWMSIALDRQSNKDWQDHAVKIATEILRAMRQKNMTQYQLANISGISRRRINKIVKGQLDISLTMITKIEQALNIKLIFHDNGK